MKCRAYEPSACLAFLWLLSSSTTSEQEAVNSRSEGSRLNLTHLYEDSRRTIFESHCAGRLKFFETVGEHPPKTVVFPLLLRPGRESCGGLFKVEDPWKAAYHSHNFQVVSDPAIATFVHSKQWVTQSIGFGGPCPETQVVNQINGLQEFHKKDAMWDALMAHERSSAGSFQARDVAPATYLVARKEDCTAWLAEVEASPQASWMAKKPEADNAKGVEVMTAEYIAMMRDEYQKSGVCTLNSMMVQYMVDPPLLIGQRKVDFRVYVLLASVKPFVALIHPVFMGRVSSETYNPALGKAFTLMGGKAENQLHPGQLAHALGKSNNWLAGFYRKLKVLMSRISGVIRLHYQDGLRNLTGMFALVGIDVLVGADERLWLGEFNLSPDMAPGKHGKAQPEWRHEARRDMLREAVALEWRLLEARLARKGRQLLPEDLEGIRGRFEPILMERDGDEDVWEYHRHPSDELDFASRLAYLEISDKTRSEL